MKSFVVSASFALCLTAALAPTSALASSITETMSISGSVEPPLGVNSAPNTLGTSQFAAFNPALGTLVSISASLSGSLNYTGLGIPADEGASLELEPQGFVPGVGYYGNFYNDFIPFLGTGLPFSFTPSGITDPVALSLYTGTGMVDLVVYDAGGNLTDLITMAGQGTVTFNYIASPEPGSFGLIVLGLFGMIAARRRPFVNSKFLPAVFSGQ